MRKILPVQKFPLPFLDQGDPGLGKMGEGVQWLLNSSWEMAGLEQWENALLMLPRLG